MKFKNTGTITKIIYDLNAEEYTNKITIKLDNYYDEEKLNIIFLDDSLPKLDNFVGDKEIICAKDNKEYEIGLLQLDLYKHYEFEFKKDTTKNPLKITKITECNHE